MTFSDRGDDTSSKSSFEKRLVYTYLWYECLRGLGWRAGP